MQSSKQLHGCVRSRPISILRFPILADRLLAVGNDKVRNADPFQIRHYGRWTAGEVKKHIAGGSIALRNRIANDLTERQYDTLRIGIAYGAVKTLPYKIVGCDIDLLIDAHLAFVEHLQD